MNLQPRRPGAAVPARSLAGSPAPEKSQDQGKAEDHSQVSPVSHSPATLLPPGDPPREERKLFFPVFSSKSRKHSLEYANRYERTRHQAQGLFLWFSDPSHPGESPEPREP